MRMIKNLFTKRDRRPVAGITKEQAMQAASWYWRSRQFGVDFPSPYTLSGEQYYSKLGLRQSVIVTANEEGPNVSVDVQFSAELTDTGTVVGIVGAIVLLPVTVAVGAVSYLEYDKDAQHLINDFWSYIYAFPKNPRPPEAAQLPPWAQGQPPQPVAPPQQILRSCPKCSGAIDPDSAYCKHCGKKL
ncbi:MAG TPA: zinc ribbon domain-containing protein [Thermoplasmata archaeon]